MMVEDSNERDLRAIWREVVDDLRRFPWGNTALTLRERFSEDRLGQAAASLTFSTIIALVPLFTVALAIFSALPEFDVLAQKLEQWLVKSLIPGDIARTVLKYLHQFSSKATSLGWGGGAILLLSALSVVLTVDNKLNEIWRVRKRRQLHRRLLMYWAGLTLGPLVLAASLTASTYLLSNSLGWVLGSTPSRRHWPWQVVEFGSMMGILALMYRVVPNTRVRWSHALIGALLAGLTLELVKRLLTWYLATVPSYSVIYGAFATVPILLVWVYLMWVVVLLGAVVAAYLPVLLRGVSRRPAANGWDFQLALEILAMLRWARDQAEVRGLGLPEMAKRAGVGDRQLHEALEVLERLAWVGALDESDARYVLLMEPARTPVRELAKALLLPYALELEAFWQRTGLVQASVAEVLPNYRP